MTIVLQNTDELKFHPVTGKKIKPSDYRTTELWDGRIAVDLGDCNVEYKPK